MSQSALSKAFSRDAQFTKEQISDILFYIKQIFGIIIGVIVALTGIMGFYGIVACIAGVSLLSHAYVFKFLGVDEDTIETKDVLKQHFMNGFFPFLLTWIVLYNIINF